MQTYFKNRAIANRYFRRFYPKARTECRKSGVHAGILFIHPNGIGPYDVDNRYMRIMRQNGDAVGSYRFIKI